MRTHSSAPSRTPAEDRSVFRNYGFSYRADSWEKSRRIVARSEFAPGELLPDWTFICVHLPTAESRKHVVRAYLKRGQSEQVHDMFKNEMHGALMSHHRFVDNQVRAWLTAISLNLMIAFEEASRGSNPVDGLRLQFAGGLSMDQRPVLWTTQEEAHEDAKNRLVVWRIARQIRIDRRLPEGEVVRVTLHDRDGRVLFEGEVG